jgi:hypothetical protein
MGNSEISSFDVAHGHPDDNSCAEVKEIGDNSRCCEENRLCRGKSILGALITEPEDEEVDQAFVLHRLKSRLKQNMTVIKRKMTIQNRFSHFFTEAASGDQAYIDRVKEFETYKVGLKSFYENMRTKQNVFNDFVDQEK